MVVLLCLECLALYVLHPLGILNSFCFLLYRVLLALQKAVDGSIPFRTEGSHSLLTVQLWVSIYSRLLHEETYLRMSGKDTDL